MSRASPTAWRRRSRSRATFAVLMCDRIGPPLRRADLRAAHRALHVVLLLGERDRPGRTEQPDRLLVGAKAPQRRRVGDPARVEADDVKARVQRRRERRRDAARATRTAGVPEQRAELARRIGGGQLAEDQLDALALGVAVGQRDLRHAALVRRGRNVLRTSLPLERGHRRRRGGRSGWDTEADRWDDRSHKHAVPQTSMVRHGLSLATTWPCDRP